jgi:hypothetical protein
MSIQLQGTREITWVDQLPEGLRPSKVYFGRDESGVGEAQIAIASVLRRPTQADLQAAWKTRGTGLTTPVVVVAVFGEQVWMLGPSQSDSMLGPVPLSQANRQLQSILDEVDAVAARQKMQSVAHSLNGLGSSGFVNHFLFASYHLRRNVPQRKDWNAATERSQSMLSKQGRDLISALGYELETVGAEVNTLLLRASSGSRRAVAVLLDESQEFDRKSAAYQISPVAHGLEVAGREDVPWVIVLRKSTLRLYPGKDGVGVGQRGQSETYFELDLNDLDPDYAGLLTLIFAADALEHGGTAEQILEDSSNYAAELGTRLRDRVYVGVVPSIAVAISEHLPQLGYQIDAEGLKVAYALTLRVLFRLLFQAYGEDTGLLPAGRNEGYDSNSLQSFIRRDLNADHSEYSDQAKSIWFDLEQVWDAIYNGNPRWAIPAYGGSLFDPETEEGALLKKFELPDSVMGPALQNLLAETTEDSVRGPVDFRSLQVRDFGTIYEGLLESSLSVAEFDLTIDQNGAFVPSKTGENVEVEAGRPYFHSSSGDRKATGSYYTPKIVVDHLIERSITPTITTHLSKVKALIDEGKDRAAGELFWDFRVADLAMGSAHFLVAAVDKIERSMRDFLTTTPVPSVRAELERLAQKAREQLSHDPAAAENINDAQLLRRQVARRCVYGLDINPLAVELARLAIWIHTFVPGLPMSSLDHNLVLGNSLTGIGSIDEAIDAIVSSANGKARSAKKNKSDDSGGLFDGIKASPIETGYQRMLRKALAERLADVSKLLSDVAAADESVKSEVEKNKELLIDARNKALPAQRIFDAAVATRLSLYAPEITREEHVQRLEDSPEVSELVASMTPAHLPLLFPEVFVRANPGFDVVIGNPPWEKIRHEPHQFWVIRDPGLRNLSGDSRNARIDHLRETKPWIADEEETAKAFAEIMKEVAEHLYKLQGGGHHDLAKLFSERFLQVRRKEGSLGVVLPWALLSLSGWRKIRESYFESIGIDAVPIRNKNYWAFEDVHPQTAIACISAFQGSGLRLVSRASSTEEFSSVSAISPFSLTIQELNELSDQFLVPWLEDLSDVDVFQKMSMQPSLGSGKSWITGHSDSSRWDFSSSGAHKNFAIDQNFDSGWRVAMARHVGPFLMTPTAEGKGLVRLNELANLGRGFSTDADLGSFNVDESHPAIVFRFPSSNDNSRTLIAAGLPKEGWVFSAGYTHGLSTNDHASKQQILALLGYMNSFTADWWVRRFVDRHVGTRIISGLRLPPWGDEQLVRVAELVELILTKSGVYELAGGLILNVTDKQISIPAAQNEIEALAMIGFGFTNEEVSGLLSDFNEKSLPEQRRNLIAETFSALREFKND